MLEMDLAQPNNGPCHGACNLKDQTSAEVSFLMQKGVRYNLQISEPLFKNDEGSAPLSFDRVSAWSNIQHP